MYKKCFELEWLQNIWYIWNPGGGMQCCFENLNEFMGGKGDQL